MERRVFREDLTSYDLRNSPTLRETSTDKVVNGTSSSETVVVQNADNRGTTKHCRCQDINSVSINSNIFKGKDPVNNSEAATCNVKNSCHTNRNTIREISKDSTIFENEEAKMNSEYHSGLRNPAHANGIDDSGIETEFSNSEESLAECDADKTNEDSPGLGCSFDDPSLPKFFHNYVEGLKVRGDSQCSLDSKPSWLDVEKYRTGQKVALKYFFGIQFAQMLSLLVVFNIPGSLEPLIFTGKSDTPFKAFKRYLSTALRVRSWYTDDLWDPESEAHKNLKRVRTMHETLRKNLEALDPKERDRKSTLSGRCESGRPEIWSPLLDELREDFAITCPYLRFSKKEFKKNHETRVCVNQTEMSITQFGFVGLFIKYPAYFGAHNITYEELDSFVHLWRCIGYLLGVEDKYNFCNGDLQAVLDKTTDLIDYFAKPNLRIVTEEWEHMTRCLIEGISYYVHGVTFEVSLLYLCSMFGLYTPRLWATLTFRQKIAYYFIKFTFWFLMRFPGALDFHNHLVEMALKYGENVSPSRLKEWEEKKYPYQENAICT